MGDGGGDGSTAKLGKIAKQDGGQFASDGREGVAVEEQERGELMEAAEEIEGLEQT
ncbi:MAG: hypothetical protein H7A45_18190 [Verrucomicrobiales bacterium]|nr:hypothetical protein [Verrucomicrobiales bacterium]MCP5525493.1 hypothetical protein [Verrucomicrobiales bacterium]